MHICVDILTIIGSDNGLSPGQCQAIISTNARMLLIEPLGTNFNEIVIGIQTFSLKKMYLKMSSGKWRPFCLGLNSLNIPNDIASPNPQPLDSFKGYSSEGVVIMLTMGQTKSIHLKQ